MGAYVRLERLLSFLPQQLEVALQVLVFSAWWVFLIWFFRREIQRRLRLQLLQEGVPICIDCGYQLRGLTEPRCPECGKPFDAKLLDGMSRRDGRE
jgi:hypothetical protein